MEVSNLSKCIRSYENRISIYLADPAKQAKVPMLRIHLDMLNDKLEKLKDKKDTNKLEKKLEKKHPSESLQHKRYTVSRFNF